MCRILCCLSFLILSSNLGVSAEDYLLRYSLKSGQTLRYEVTHAAKTKTRIKGEEEASNVHTTSQRHLAVTDANDSGATFNHIVDSVEMTQQQGDKDEIRWDSESGEEAPKMFSKVAEQMGQTLATIKINTRGQELEREDFGGTKASLGMGSLTLALPEEPIRIGGSWSVPREVKTRTEENEVKTIKIREVYTLEKVKTGVATLSIRSEPLTPIDQESVKAQVVQQLSNGEIRFDLDAGCMLSKKLDWDETVVGFQGPNSMMEYRAKMTETLIPETERSARLR
ncbi:hypothetical protein LF1_18320 [Rubripirellula obstinata]|uniref:Secreted protein n=1 Tax=Rubripirellula obstinata TaxID=406547 RepID=A0A5B1CGJ1_9BACT|nr:hypothetical protein [Rubripirellula obstinata]KAA1259302.1 hypothetical protein LF1_18320 [Rubripirellula obstinata]